MHKVKLIHLQLMAWELKKNTNQSIWSEFQFKWMFRQQILFIENVKDSYCDINEVKNWKVNLYLI